jgi:hypothetical protein
MILPASWSRVGTAERLRAPRKGCDPAGVRISGTHRRSSGHRSANKVSRPPSQWPTPGLFHPGMNVVGDLPAPSSPEVRRTCPLPFGFIAGQHDRDSMTVQGGAPWRSRTDAAHRRWARTTEPASPNSVRERE